MNILEGCTCLIIFMLNLDICSTSLYGKQNPNGRLLKNNFGVLPAAHREVKINSEKGAQSVKKEDFMIMQQSLRISEAVTMNESSSAVKQIDRKLYVLTTEDDFIGIPQNHSKFKVMTMNENQVLSPQGDRKLERIVSLDDNIALQQTHTNSIGPLVYDSIVDTLQGVFNGPLADRYIILYIDSEVEERFDIDDLLSRSETPLYVARTRPTLLSFAEFQEKEESQLRYGIFGSLCLEDDLTVDVDDDTSHDLYVNNSTVYHKIKIHLDISGAVLVYITAKDVGSIRWFESNSMAGLLVVSLDDSCDVSTLRNISLTHQTSNVVLFCPYTRNRRMTDLKVDQFRDKIRNYLPEFEVSTWLPYHPDQKLHSLGLWSPSKFNKWEDLFVDRFSSLYNCTLYISSDDSDPPFFYKTSETSLEDLEGTCYRIMTALGQWMNFRMSFTEASSFDGWGELVNGTWIGMLGDVFRREKDLTINNFVITEERANDFDYSVSHFREGFGFIVKIPPPLPRWMSLAYPFTMTVWGGIFAASIFSAVTFYFLPYKDKRMSPLQTFLTVAMSLMNQSVDHVPSVSSTRLLFGVWCLSAYIIVLSYTCNLIAVLTIPVYPRRIRTVEQLVKSNLRLCMLDYGEFVPDALATSKHPDFFALGSRLDMVPMTNESVNQFYGDENCAALVIEGGHSHVDAFNYLQVLYTQLGYGDDVYSLKEQIYEASLVFYFGKNTPWKFKFDIGILHLVESGFVDKWYKDIMQQEIKSLTVKDSVESKEQALSLAHLQGPFYILLVGLTVASSSFFFEILLDFKT